MGIYYTVSVLITLTALLGYLNVRYVKLPSSIGLIVSSLILSLLLIVVGKIYPDFLTALVVMVKGVDFYGVVMNVMLGFLLFAGSFHLDINHLKEERTAILSLSVLGTLLSTFLIGGFAWVVLELASLQIGFLYCLLFGALISPTDPIAVLGILKDAKIPRALEMKIAGESLFNDGVAVVIFVTIFDIVKLGAENVSFLDVVVLFTKEAIGGLFFGYLIGQVGFVLLRSINNYKVEVLITLSMVMGGYALAGMFHISGALAMVVAGLITGNKSRELGMSEETREYVDKFWELIDEILNAVLFLLIGLEMIVLNFTTPILIVSCLLIVLLLVARYISVLIPVFFIRKKVKIKNNELLILTWGGLRGGISVALALSLPKGPISDVIIPITYCIVIFSIVVQGLSIGKFAKRVLN